ncbi:hypothetical protein ACH4T9_05275 [Micromonospora sp. NPDC020750]|uniref:hypothetical protein n=1 Tax=unclassified Micromonospora TaxID=2617518 RepID=UPI0037973BDC
MERQPGGRLRPASLAPARAPTAKTRPCPLARSFTVPLGTVATVASRPPVQRSRSTLSVRATWKATPRDPSGISRKGVPPVRAAGRTVPFLSTVTSASPFAARIEPSTGTAEVSWPDAYTR